MVSNSRSVKFKERRGVFVEPNYLRQNFCTIKSSMDRFIFIVGLLGSIIVASLIMFTKDSDDSPEMECWCPAQFTSSHRAYTNLICRNMALYSAVYLPLDSQIPSRDLTQRANRKFLSIAKKVDTDDKNITWVIGEMITSIVLYLFIRGIRLVLSIASQKEGASLHKSRTMVLLYIIVYLLAALVWVVLATGVQQKGKDKEFVYTQDTGLQVSEDEVDQSNRTYGVFLCDFEIRHQAKVHSYVVQCTYASAKPQEMVKFTCLNQMLCLTLCAMIVCHIVTTFIIFPFLAPISSEKQEPVSCVPFTDGYLVTVLCEGDTKSHPPAFKDNELSSKETKI